MKRPGRRLRRWLFRILILGLLLAVVFLGVARTRLEGWVRQELEHRVVNQLGGDLRLGELEIRLRSLEARFTDLELTLPEESGGPLRVAIPAGRVRIPWRGLLGLRDRRIHLSELTLHEPLVETAREALRGRGRRPRGERLRLDIRIDRLGLESGRWRHADEERPLDLDLRRIDLDAVWSADRRTILGRGSLALSFLRDPFITPLELDLSTSFRWTSTRLELFSVRAVHEDLEIHGSADLSWADGFTMSGGGDLAANLDPIATTLRPGFPKLGGRVEGEFSLAVLDGDLSVEADVLGSPLRFEMLSAERVGAHLKIDREGLEVTGLEAALYGGSARGNVSVTFGEERGYGVDVSCDDLDSLRLFQLARLELPLSSRVSGRLAIRGAPGGVRTWIGGGEFIASASQESGDGVPMSGVGSYTFHEGRLETNAERVEVGGGEFSLDLGLFLDGTERGGLLRLDGLTGDARTTQIAALRILESFDFVLPEPLARPLDGSGPLQAEIEFGRNQGLDLRVNLDRGSWSGTDFDRAGVDLSLAQGVLEIRRLALVEGESRVDGSLRWELEEPLPGQLRALLNEIELESVLPLIGLQLDLTGRLSGEIDVVTRHGVARGKGAFQVENGSAFGEQVDSVRGEIQIERDIATLSDLLLSGPALEAVAELVWNFDTGTGRFVLTRGAADLGTLALLEPLGLAVGGNVELAGELALSGSGATGSMRVVGHEWELEHYALGPVGGEIEVGPDGATGRLTAGGEAGWSLQAGLGFGGDLPVELILRLERSVLEFRGDEEIDAWAEASGEVRLHGDLLRPEGLGIEGALESVELAAGPHRLQLADRLPLTMRERSLRVGPFQILGEGTDLTMELLVGLSDGLVEGRAQGLLDAALVSVFAPDFRASGGARVDLTLAGEATDSRIDGTVSLEAGRLRWLNFPQTLEQIDLELLFDGREIMLTHLSGLLGGGELTATGRAVHDGSGPLVYRAEIDAQQVRLAWPTWFEGVYDADLVLQGQGKQAALSGKIEVLRGLYTEEFDLASAFGIGTREYSTTGAGQYPFELGFDLEIAADGDVWVRNDLAQLEARFDLKLTGTPERPELTGRVSTLQGGRIEFRDSVYRIETGHLDFVERDRLDPRIFVRANTNVSDYEIQLTVEGTVSRFEFQLSSSPSLGQEDIIALLATGKTLREMGIQSDSPNADYTGDLAASYFAGALAGPVERQIEDLLGLDRVLINPAIGDGSTDATTRVTVGKRINDDVTVLVTDEFGTDRRQIYQVEWQATRKHVVTVQTDTRAGTGGTIRYSNRYWWKKRKPPSEEAVLTAEVETEEAGAGSTLVSRVELEGVSDEAAESLMTRLPFEAGGEFRRAEMFAGVEAIRRYFIREGRITARVEASARESGENDGKVVVAYRIEPGPVTTVVLEGVGEKDGRRIRVLLESLWAEALFEETLLRDSSDAIRRYFQERGRYAVDVDPRVTKGVEAGEVRFVIDPGPAVKVTGLEIVGAEQMDEERILRQMLTRKASLFSRGHLDPKVLEDDLAAIRNLYGDHGFLDVALDDPRIRLNENGSEAEITIRVDEGPRFTVESIEFGSTGVYDDERLRDWSGMSVGDIFSPSALLAAETALASGLDAEGFPQARVRGTAERAESRVAVAFLVELNDRSTIGAVEITGNLLTRDKVIRRELQFAPGDLLTREALLRSQQRLYRLGVFRSIRISHEAMDPADPSLRRVKIHVEEAKPLAWSAGLGFDSERGLQGSFSTSNDNLGGRVRTVAIQAFISETLQRAQIVGGAPRLFGWDLPLLIDYAIEHRVDPGYTVDLRSLALRVDRKLSPDWSGFLRYAYQNQDLSDVFSIDLPERDKVEDIRLGNLGGALVRDRRDDSLMTRNGNYLQVTGRWFSNLMLSDANFVTGTVTASSMRTYRNRTSFATVVRVGLGSTYGSTEQIPISERFFAGGQSTIRGFKLDEVGPKKPDGRPTGGEGLLVLNLEFQFPVWKRLKGITFYDAGNVYFRLDEFDPLDVRHVLGLGARFEAPFGPVRLEYGWKIDRKTGETPGELTFAIGALF